MEELLGEYPNIWKWVEANGLHVSHLKSPVRYQILGQYGNKLERMEENENGRNS